MNQINCPLIELNDEVFAFVNKFNTDEELLRSGGLPTKMLDRLAFGFSEEEMKTIDPKDLNIKWKDDMLNVKWEQKQSGLSKKQWAEKINLSEPIDVIFEKNKFYIDDGHHRSYAALILNKPLNINLTIKTNPITKITPSLSYDQFHRCLFQQVKNMKLQEQINKMKIFNTLLEDKIKSESFQEFSKKRLDGATKITDNAKEKGGSALLTYHTEHKFFKYSELSSSNIISTNKKFVDDYNKMVDDEKKLNESVLRMKSIMGINELTVYRGIGNNMQYNNQTVYRGIGNNMQYNNQNTENEGFLWVALDKSLAANYASYDSNSREYNIQTLDIQQPKNPFKFPFKTNVHVRGSDMTNQLRLVRDQKYKHKEINIYDYRILTDIINEYGQAAGDNLEAYHTKMDKPGASIKLAKVLSHMGYDAVQVDTDQGITYGIIKI